MWLFLVFEGEIFSLVILPVLIFFARVIDVSLGTLRVILISKEQKKIAAIVGFFEIMVWLVAITSIVQNLNNPIALLAYAAGFATGTFAGIWIEERLSLGQVLVQIVTHKNFDQMIEKIKFENFKFTTMNAQGLKGEVKFIFAVMERKNVERFIEIVKLLEPDAFYTIEDVKSVDSVVHATKKKQSLFGRLSPFEAFRKGK